MKEQEIKKNKKRKKETHFFNFLPLGGGTFEEFKKDVQSVSSSPAEARTMILNYSRKEFEQTGDGHFSPMGGYHEGLDVRIFLTDLFVICFFNSF